MSDHLTREQLAQYRERNISVDELIEVDGHLSQCADCRKQMGLIHGLDAALTPSLASRSESDHLTYEQLDAYVDGGMSSAEQNVVRAHTRSCLLCAEELRDLEGFRDELGLSPKQQDQDKAQFAAKGFGEQRVHFASWFKFPRVAAALTVALGIVVVVVWQQERRSHLDQTRTEVANHPTPQPAASPSLSNEIAGLESAEQQVVREAITRGKLTFPPDLKNLLGSGGTMLGASSDAPRFPVSGPAGESIFDPRPIFRWRALPGAISYSVTVFDVGLNSVESSPALHGMQWKSVRALDRGCIYLWQVNATMSDGTTVTSPQPPDPEARFEVLPQAKADALEHFRQSYPDAHLELGILYAHAGALDAAQEELKQISATDSDYQTAQEFLASIKQMRRGER